MQVGALRPDELTQTDERHLLFMTRFFCYFPSISNCNWKLERTHDAWTIFKNRNSAFLYESTGCHGGTVKLTLVALLWTRDARLKTFPYTKCSWFRSTITSLHLTQTTCGSAWPNQQKVWLVTRWHPHHHGHLPLLSRLPRPLRPDAISQYTFSNWCLCLKPLDNKKIFYSCPFHFKFPDNSCVHVDTYIHTYMYMCTVVRTYLKWSQSLSILFHATYLHSSAHLLNLNNSYQLSFVHSQYHL
jgi:hypothetical protein